MCIRDRADYEIVSLSQDSINVYFDYYKEGEYTLQPDVVYDGASYVKMCIRDSTCSERSIGEF